MAEVRQRKILVVDDNAAFLDIVAVVFGQDWKVLSAEDGARGLELARQERPDLIILDWMLPRVSGSEFLRELELDAPARLAPVIVVTAAKLEAEELAKIREAGVASVLKKPCGIEALRAQVRAVLEKSG